MLIKKIFKFSTLAVIIVGGTYLLWPDSDEKVDGQISGEKINKKDVKFNLRVVAGPFYKPGIAPGGIGELNVAYQEVVDEYERLHPDVKITIATGIAMREYLVTQLSAGRAPDILMVNVEDVWVDIHKNWYVPLDKYLEQPNPYCKPGEPGSVHWWDQFKYQAISRGKLAPDGKMYCLTYDLIETAFYYNKDIFKELNLKIPKNWDELADIVKKLRDADYTPIQTIVGTYADWGVDLMLDQIYYNILPGIDLVRDPTREEYLKGYLDWDEICFLYKKGFFTKDDPRYVELWRQIYNMRKFSNQDIATADMVRAFVKKKAAILWLASNVSYRFDADKDLDFDWDVFYIPQFTTNMCKYAPNVPMCVIGGAGVQYEVSNSAYGDTGDPETSERLKVVIDFLQFLTEPKNYEKIVNEHPILVPNVVGVPVLPLMKPYEEILKRRYTTTKWTYSFDIKFQDILQRMLHLYLDDHITLDEFIEWQERNLADASERFIRRKKPNFDAMEKEWKRLAPLRKNMIDLPPGAKL